MRARVMALLAAVAVALGGCGGIRVVGIVGGNGAPVWAAQIVQPPGNTLFLTPGAAGAIFVQLLPVNGVFVTGPVFLNGFNALNAGFRPCNGIVNVFNNGLTPAPFNSLNIPTIGLTVSPISSGSCSLPLNLGQAGTITIFITVGLGTIRHDTCARHGSGARLPCIAGSRVRRRWEPER